MDEDQRFLRHAVPGIAVVLLFASALAVTQPHIICWLIKQAAPWSLIGFLFGGVIASGGLGFLPGQLYFALPACFNTPDHGSAIFETRRECWSIHPYKESQAWLEAQRIARYRFQERLGRKGGNETLIRSTRRRVQRMASTGTAVTGPVIGFAIWL